MSDFLRDACFTPNKGFLQNHAIYAILKNQNRITHNDIVRDSQKRREALGA